MLPVIHRPINSNDTKYTLHHLQPHRVIIEGHGRDGSAITIRISYKSHVYSIAGQDNAAAYQFFDEGGKRRYFCDKRYQLSLNLPQICGEMIKLNYPTWISQDHNRKNNMAVIDLNPKDGLRYIILYALLPSKAEDISVELVVKSAYEGQVNNIGKLKKLGVTQIIKKCYFEKISIPK